MKGVLAAFSRLGSNGNQNQKTYHRNLTSGIQATNLDAKDERRNTDARISSKFFESLRKKATGKFKNGSLKFSKSLVTEEAEPSNFNYAAQFSRMMKKPSAKKASAAPVYKVSEELKYKPSFDPESIDLKAMVSRDSLRLKPKRGASLTVKHVRQPSRQSALGKSKARIHFDPTVFEQQPVETSATLIEINAKIDAMVNDY